MKLRGLPVTLVAALLVAAPGDVVSVEGYSARDGSKGTAARYMAWTRRPPV